MAFRPVLPSMGWPRVCVTHINSSHLMKIAYSDTKQIETLIKIRYVDLTLKNSLIILNCLTLVTEKCNLHITLYYLIQIFNAFFVCLKGDTFKHLFISGIQRQETRVRVPVEIHIFTSIKVASSWRKLFQVAPVEVLT